MELLEFAVQDASDDGLDEGFEVAEAEEVEEVAGGSVHGLVRCF